MSFRTRAMPESFTWPPRPRAIAFVQVGDLVEMLLHSKKAQFATCEFCQSVNHLSDVRCRTCGGALPPRAEPDVAPVEPETADEPSAISEARSLRNVMQLALLPPLLLFAGFVAWNALRAPPAPQPAAAASRLYAQPKALQTAPRVAAARSRTAPVELGLGPNEVLLSSAHAATPPAWSGAAGNAFDPAASEPLLAPADAPPASKTRKATATASVRLGRDPLADCNGSNFFARAICINTRCADPKTAQLGQCREAIRQRRIDEARRNPSLMG
ncbi:hypothetical protein [Variovorax saccharolyticus]|uniref:hypothetical protein n=1 Tax=Variovorax saccharolyticus TaxID=3053516 RepID=UPI002578639F|nr:hypothetical protein [Variovorax sp. J22R187]MDM0020716.1 hypothetical protein [Variovorax sp. J22R187]